MIARLIREIPETKQRHKIRSVAIGLGYIAVDVEGSGLGLCANILPEEKASCTVFPRAGSLRGSTVKDMLAFGQETDLLSRSLALATVNAVSNQEGSGSEADVFDTVPLREGDRAVMVGLIAPVAAVLESRGCTVDVFEHRDVRDERVRPQDALEKSVSRADIIIITATSIVNGTLPEILALRNSARAVILMGPSTPMLPRAFLSTPITLLAGSRVIDPAKAVHIVMEGGGTQALYKNSAMKKIVRETKR